MLEKRMKRIYRQEFFGNRSILARAFDFIALRAIVFVACYLFIATSSKNGTLGLVLAIIITLMVSVVLELYKNMRIDKFVEAKRLELSKEFMFERLVLAQRDDFLRIVRKLVSNMGYKITGVHPIGLLCSGNLGQVLVCALQSHPSKSVDAQQLLEFYRAAVKCDSKEIVIISTSPFSGECQAFAKKISEMPIQLISRKPLLDLANKVGLLPPMDMVERALLEELESKRMTLKKLRQAAFEPSRAKGYAVCGVILFAAAFITGQYIYYPAIGSVCIFLSLLSFFKGRYTTA